MSSPAWRTPLAFGMAALVVCLGFAAFTGHMWEDYFITFRASLNLATGHGLVFQPGERVHTFTSPLGTLLPALFALGGGDESVAVRALWGLRIVSALAVGGAVWIAVRAFQRDRLVSIATFATGTALVFDPKMVDFAMNGMETGLVVFFVALSWHGFAVGGRFWRCALGFAGLQWTRPDGFIYFGALAGGWLLFGRSAGEASWRQRMLFLIRAAVVGGALYLPWFVFAWIYYGSPVPHTILAKAQHHSMVGMAKVLGSYPWDLLFGDSTLHDVFRPAYYFFGGWPQSLLWPARFLAVGAALTWTWPRVAPAGRISSSAFFLGGFYLSAIPQAPWYFPGWQSLGWISWAYLLHAVWSVRTKVTWARVVMPAATRITTALIVLLQGGLFVCVAWQVRAQQALIETGHRREIGLWLKHQARSSDTVFLECLGYIGYYSGLKMLDFPGLSSPEVVAVRGSGHRSFAEIIAVLKPNWLVLRPLDEARVFAELPALRQAYQAVHTFSVRRDIDALGHLPGRGYLNFDAVFVVYRRAADAELRP